MYEKEEKEILCFSCIFCQFVMEKRVCLASRLKGSKKVIVNPYAFMCEDYSKESEDLL